PQSERCCQCGTLHSPGTFQHEHPCFQRERPAGRPDFLHRHLLGGHACNPCRDLYRQRADDPCRGPGAVCQYQYILLDRTFLRIWAYLNQLKIGGNKLNPKIDKLARDIEKTEKKIADLQKKLELFKEEKTRLENEDYGDIGRDFHLTPKELAEFLKEHRAGTLTVPEAAPPAGEQEAGHEE